MDGLSRKIPPQTGGGRRRDHHALRRKLSGVQRGLPAGALSSPPCRAERERSARYPAQSKDPSNSKYFLTRPRTENFINDQSRSRHPGPSAPDTGLWNFVESAAHDVFRAYNFQEIRTPIFESTELFARGVGEETDIVAKEMYTWED